MLTLKQENFAQNIVEGLTQLESYRRAYDTDNMSEPVMSNEACKLVNNREVAVRIQQLRDQLAERLLFPRIERLEKLKKIAQSAEQDKDSINAIKAFNDMVGDSAPQKIAVEHSGTIDTVKTLDDFYK